MVEWIEEPGTVGQRANTAFARATQTRMSVPTPTSFRASAAPVAYAPAVINTVTWQWQVNNFSSSGNVTLGAYEDPKLAACEWVKDSFPPGLSLTVDGWFINAQGHWEKEFTFVTDASFWALDCATWLATHTLSGPPTGLPYQTVAQMQVEAGDRESAQRTMLHGRLTDYVRSIGGEMLGASPAEIYWHGKVWNVVGGSPESPSLRFARYPNAQDRTFLRPQSLGALGQAPTTNWTGVPEPPFWAATGLPWPPTGQLPANPPPGWYLIANSPPPIGWAGPWPPSWPPTAADVPGWPAGWPFPLPAAPPAAPPSAVPPGQVQPPAQTAKKSSGSGAGVAVAVGLAALVIVAIVAAGSG